MHGRVSVGGGLALGLTLGASVGECDGVPVGVLLGASVGASVGECDGVPVGSGQPLPKPVSSLEVKSPPDATSKEPIVAL